MGDLAMDGRRCRGVPAADGESAGPRFIGCATG